MVDKYGQAIMEIALGCAKESMTTVCTQLTPEYWDNHEILANTETF